MSGKLQMKTKRVNKSMDKNLILMVGILVSIITIAVICCLRIDDETLTWDEFIRLSPEEQDAFFLEFDTPKDFTQWMANAKKSEALTSDGLDLPWENGEKEPVEYLWEEFQNLSPLQQEMFFESFATEDDFEAWMERVRNGEITADEAETQTEFFEDPASYTYEEFADFSEEDQEIFVDSFDSYAEFQRWLDSVIPEDAEEIIYLPWENGEKCCAEYTMEEFNQLTPEQQEAFFDSFDSPEDFEKWMKSQDE